MKNLVTLILCLWLGFVTFAQTFNGLERFLLLNDWRFPSLPIALLFAILIGSGYANVLRALLDKPIPRKQTITYCFMIALAVFLTVAVFSLAFPGQWMHSYIAADQLLRQRFDITIAGMDYGNTVMLAVTTLYWFCVLLASQLVLFKSKHKRSK